MKEKTGFIDGLITLLALAGLVYSLWLFIFTEARTAGAIMFVGILIADHVGTASKRLDSMCEQLERLVDRVASVITRNDPS